MTLQQYTLRSISSPGAVKNARHTPLAVHIDVAHPAKVEHQPVVASERPITEWPPARTETGLPCSRTNASGDDMVGGAQQATRRGRRSIMELNKVQIST